MKLSSKSYVINLLSSLGALLILLVVACRNPSPKINESVNDLTEDEPIVGFWDSGNDTGLTYFRGDGTYVSSYRSNDAEWDGYEGKWAKTKIQIYSVLSNEGLLPGIPASDTFTKHYYWCLEKPDDKDAKLENGAVYEFISDGESAGSSKNLYFSHLVGEDMITIDHGCYKSGMKRLPSHEENKD